MNPLLARHPATQFPAEQPTRSLALWLCLLLFAGMRLSLQAQSISASAQVSGQAGAGNNFDYLVTVERGGWWVCSAPRPSFALLVRIDSLAQT